LFFFSIDADRPADNVYCALRDPHQPVYFGTAAIHVPAAASGTYTIGLIDQETFATDHEAVFIPVAAKLPARIVIESGACCRLLGPYAIECADSVTSIECSCPDCVWTENTPCAELNCLPRIGACCDHSAVSTCRETTADECRCEKCSWTADAACDQAPCESKFTAIPTTSDWGLVILAIVLAVAGKIAFGRL
jgi:hypothetical protein